MNEDPLYTKWGEEQTEKALTWEYPRPQMEREKWLCLNGLWDYAIDSTLATPTQWQGKILVPFSPEAPLSGVNRQLLPGETLHYKLDFTLPDEYKNQNILLHFGAVDQYCEVYLNGEKIGSHMGGFLPFSFDITKWIKDENTLTLNVQDDSDDSFHTRGKQSLDRGGIWYTAQSGIWGTVWIEPVPYNHITTLKITPLFDEHKVMLHLGNTGEHLPCRASVTDGENIYEAAFYSDETAIIDLPFFRSWSPEYPFLYNLTITMERDYVKSYFGMRKFGVERGGDGFMRLYLNGKPYFHTGVLDQGYWPDGLYTAPTDEAMKADISDMKRLGFNMLRKHMKIEPLRWYYHCDKMGMLVWQDMPFGGEKVSFMNTSLLPLIGFRRFNDSNYKNFGRLNKEGRDEFLKELDDTVDLLYNVVSLAVWVPFNEGWGQFDAVKTAKRIESMDNTRTIDMASGWHDQNAGELCSLHVYFRKFKPKKDPRAIVLSEFGGYNFNVEGHGMGDENFGYRKYKSFKHLATAFEKLYRNEIIPAVKEGLSATVYTQLSDVEDEKNGLLTYDRKICKFHPDMIKEINRELTSLPPYNEGE